MKIKSKQNPIRSNPNKSAIIKPVIRAAIILASFYAIEIVWVYCDIFPDYTALLIADIILRFVLGAIALVILNGYTKRGESKFTVKQLFTNKIPPKIWLVLIPFIIYILLPFLKLVTVFAVGTESVFIFCLVIFQQFATGFFEEGVQRGLMMNGLIRFNTETVKQRLFTCVITGTFFGLGHALNIVFGENPLVQVPFTFAWGMFIAAVYMLSDNILLVMLLHAFSDITFRIVKGLFGIDHEAGICRIVEHARTGFEIVILPLVAVLICVYYDNLKNRKSDAELRK